MVVILINDRIHIKDIDTEQETYCGLEYSHKSADHIKSGALYIDQLRADMLTEYPEAEECSDCVEGYESHTP